MTDSDLDDVLEIDGAIQSTRYLHVTQDGESPVTGWRFEERPLRERAVQRNRLSDESQFFVKQILRGIEEGGALIGEHDNAIVALILFKIEMESSTMRVLDLRVDIDHRREGIASALVFQAIREARERQLRAVTVETKTDNAPANAFFGGCGFELAGLDTRRTSNHDLVKESVTLFWYAPLD